MSGRVRITCWFEVELEDGPAGPAAQDVAELRADGARVREALAPVRRVIDGAPHLRLVSWSASAASAGAE